jgi:glycosyltransferase involved in cell wall biosynthesis
VTRVARVLWLAKGLGRGGAEQLLVSSAPHVDPSRFDVEVAYLLPWKDALVPDLVARGVPVRCLNQRSEADLRWAIGLRRLVAERGYDVVHTHMPLPAVAARLLLGRRVRLVHTEHNVWHRYRRATYWANALTYRRNDGVIAVSHAVAASITPNRAPALPVRVIHHGIDQVAVAASGEGPAREAARQALGLPADAFVVGTVGNFTPKKDQRTMIDALAILRETKPGAMLTLIGTGKLEDELRSHAKNVGLRNAVVFAGSRNDVQALLPAFDVFALSSLFEGLSIALVEAMAAGLPCVATAVGGVSEVLQNGVQGRLVPPRSARALGGALAELAASPQLRAQMSAQALERARMFDIHEAVNQIEDLYDDVLARRP